MALIAHWPLNGNTNDISGNGLHGTPTNITYGAGKIGQAASFDNTARYVTIQNGDIFNLKSQVSLCAWIKMPAYISTQYPTIIAKGTTFGGTQSYSLAVTNTGMLYFEFLNEASTRRNIGYSLSNNYAIDTWLHVVGTNNNGIINLYVNGIKVANSNFLNELMLTTSSNILISDSNSQRYFNGLINDVRIYDHALTDMEIQEIARAKILHYTFDDMQEPTTNLLSSYVDTSTRTLSGYANNQNVTITLDKMQDGTNGIKVVSNQSTSSPGVDLGIISGLSTNTDYTFSAFIESIQNVVLYINKPQQTSNSTYPNKAKVSMTFNTSSSTSMRLYILMTNMPVGGFFKFSSPQLEKKNYATEYVYGSRTGRVNDYSGFFNHSIALTEATTPKWTPEAKIGTGAYTFNGVNNFIRTGVVPGTENFSISLFFKPHSSSGDPRLYWAYGANRAILNISSNKLQWYIQTSTATVGYITSALTYTLNQWNHVVLRYNGTLGELFINGVKDSNTGSITGYSLSVAFNIATNYMQSSNFFDGEIDDFRFYATPLSDADILDLYNTRAEIEESGVLYARDFLSDCEETINLITSPLNSYPSIGMGHGTYSADSAGTYNNGNPYSIGNIVSITNNILTVDGTGKALYTYDCIYPTTTGGGLTSGAEYFIKKHATNQYSFHTYNSSDNGSQTYINSETGGFQVHYGVDRDTRIAINITNFPVQWGGQPHRANQSMVKQVITNGFNYKGRIHDCVRIVTSHRYPDPINSYMAYGVYPMAIAGKYYTFSFYIRAVNDAAVGKNIQMTLWTSGGWSGGNYAYTMPITKEWKRYEMTALAPNSGAVNMYFPGINGGGDAEIAEIQCEQKTYATEFTTTYRPAIELPSTLDFAGNEVHETRTANFEDFSTVGIVDGLVGYWPLNKNTIDYSGLQRNGTASGAINNGDSYYFDGINDIINFGTGDTFFPLYTHSISLMFRSDGTTPTTGVNPGIFGFTYGIRCLLGSTGNLQFGLYKTTGNTYISANDSYNYHDSQWHIMTTTCDGTTIKLYIDGTYKSSGDVSSFWDGYTSWPTNAWLLGRDNNDSVYFFRGNMKQLKLFNRALTAEEIKIEYNTMFNNEVQIQESGILYAKDIIQY